MLEENRFITELRGIAALMVVIFHFICVSNKFIDNSVLIDFVSYAKHGVQIFFVISGYILTISMIKGNFKFSHIFKFIIKRIIRIEPPYLVSLIMILIILRIKSYVMHTGFGDTVNIKQVLLHFGYLIPFSQYNWLNIVYWTLAIEFQFYFVLALIFPICLKTINSKYVVLVLLSSIFLLHGKYPAIEFLFWLPIFITGICLAFMTISDSFENLKLIFLILVLDILIFQAMGSTIGLVVLITQFSVANVKSLGSIILYKLGQFSYSIYLIHTIIGFTLINLVSKINDNSLFRFLMLIVILVITIIISFYYYKIFEKPFQKLSSKIKYSQP